MSEHIDTETYDSFECVRTERRPLVITDNGRFELDALGLSNERITELVEAMQRYRYDGAVATAERVVAAGPAQSHRTEYGEWITLPDMYDFEDSTRIDGQCSELAWKLRQELIGKYNTTWATSWLERVNREQHRRGDDELGLYILVGTTPTHFTPEFGADSPHFWLGLATKRDVREYQLSDYEPEAGDEPWNDEEESYDTEDDEYEEGDEYYGDGNDEEQNVRYRRDWDPFLHLDPAFGVIAAAEDRYAVSEVMEGWTAPNEYADGNYVGTYSCTGGAVKVNATCSTLRQSADGSVVYGIGFVREGENGPLSPCVSLLHSDSSLDYGVRMPDGSCIWTTTGMTLSEAARREAAAVLDVLSTMQIVDAA